MERDEHQDHADVDGQAFPEPVSEEREIQPDDDRDQGYEEQRSGIPSLPGQTSRADVHRVTAQRRCSELRRLFGDSDASLRVLATCLALADFLLQPLDIRLTFLESGSDEVVEQFVQRFLAERLNFSSHGCALSNGHAM